MQATELKSQRTSVRRPKRPRKSACTIGKYGLRILATEPRTGADSVLILVFIDSLFSSVVSCSSLLLLRPHSAVEGLARWREQIVKFDNTGSGRSLRCASSPGISQLGGALQAVGGTRQASETDEVAAAAVRIDCELNAWR